MLLQLDYLQIMKHVNRLLAIYVPIYNTGWQMITARKWLKKKYMPKAQKISLD